MAYVVGQFTITSTLLIILSSALGLNFYLIGNLLNILLIVYTMITYKKLFAINMKETMIGTLLFFLILTITFIAGSVLWAFYLYQSGAFENLN
ncbi:hypothetical protein [Mesonia mobilis]|nr:hypothetical protein [Mesonia mobilis]